MVVAKMLKSLEIKGTYMERIIVSLETFYNFFSNRQSSSLQLNRIDGWY